MSKPGFWSAVCLAAGTMVGVGLLAVPVITGLLGFGPGLALSLLAAAMMWAGGALIVERAVDRRLPHGDIASLYAADIGRGIRWITIPVYLLLFYGVLVAYLSAAAGLVAGLVTVSAPPAVWTLLVFAGFSLFTLFGQSLMLRFNGVIVTAMVIAFGVMLVSALGRIEAANLRHVNLPLLPFALPVLSCAFTYHSVIPLVCRRLDHDRRAIHLALGLAVLIAFLMTSVWLMVVTGTLPYRAAGNAPSLVNAYHSGIPATLPLAQVTGSRLITACAMTFSLLALLTSYLGIGASLSSFLPDVVPFLRPARRRSLLFAAVFLPPLSLAMIEPDVFLDMVDVIGGFNIIVLFGFLPVIAFLKTRTRGRPGLKALMLVMLLFFLLVFSAELGKVLHLLVPAV